MTGPVVKVASRSFSKHPVLRREITDAFADVVFNESGATLSGEALVDFFGGAEGAVIGLEPITGALLDQCPDHGIHGFERYVALAVLAKNMALFALRVGHSKA